MGNFLKILNNSAERDGSYLPTLDGWRAIAITLVLFEHGSDSINNVLNAVGINISIDSVGLLGVQIFFGLSGFLITSRLIASENKYSRISLRSFYIRRAFRILPPALVFLATIGILALLGIIPITFGRWISSLFFFSGGEEEVWVIFVADDFFNASNVPKSMSPTNDKPFGINCFLLISFRSIVART